MEETSSTPRVTALILARNAAPALRQCLTALEQSNERKSLEILVVDNGSSDDTQQLGAEFPNVIFMRLPKNFGRTKALNVGLRTAKGEFIFFCDPQVQAAPDTITTLANMLATTPDAGGACPWVDATYRLPTAEDFSVALKQGDLPGIQSTQAGEAPIVVEYPKGAPLMVRRQFLKGMNFLDGRFGEYWADADLCLQIKSGGKKIYMVPQARFHRNADTQDEDSPVHSADRALGAAEYLAKQQGFGAGLKFRLQALAGVLGKTITFQNPGYNAKRFAALISGQKVDGTQE